MNAILLYLILCVLSGLCAFLFGRFSGRSKVKPWLKRHDEEFETQIAKLVKEAKIQNRA